jgi:hypothetical protein
MKSSFTKTIIFNEFLVDEVVVRFDSSSSSFFNRHYNPSGVRSAQLSLSVLSREVLQSGVDSWHSVKPSCGTSNPQLVGEPGI